MKKLVLFFALLFSINTYALTPQEELKDYKFTQNDVGVVQFDNAVDIFDSFGDYYNENNSLKIENKKPLKLRISPVVLANDDKEVIKNTVDRAFLYAVYNTFTYSNLDKVTVSSIPVDMDSSKLLKNIYQIKPVTVTREKALEALNKFNIASSFNDLVVLKTDSEILTAGLSHSDKYKELMYNETTLNKYVQFLIKK
ncbi:hypothetical protein [Gallibacterium anatis]|uniref:hypothetical protein n=1 Tax=Gallibacterium anatis TaxID=750 RepID=UPI00053210C6|nr:hypothetical protein [Gallibacterium anatis]KGQ40079.1 hypothetical protein JP30_08635 [Gallibacterium anatis IPDH697-78]